MNAITCAVGTAMIDDVNIVSIMVRYRNMDGEWIVTNYLINCSS